MIGRTDNDQDTITEPNSDTTIKLSEYGFNITGSTINIKDPELEIGTVNDNSLNIDAEKQALQDQFMKNMSEKFKKRFMGNP